MPDHENAAVADALEPFENSLPKGLSDSEKIEQIRCCVLLLADEVRKLTAFLTAPKEGPSALDALVSAIGELTAETRAQSQVLDGISNTLENLVSPEVAADADAGSSGGVAPEPDPEPQPQPDPEPSPSPRMR